MHPIFAILMLVSMLLFAIEVGESLLLEFRIYIFQRLNELNQTVTEAVGRVFMLEPDHP